MADRVLRGSRMGAVSYETDRDHDLAPRQMVRYKTETGDIYDVPFAHDAEIPETWQCKNGQTGHLMEGEGVSAKPTKPPRTHWDMLRERRSIEELDQLLEERIDQLRRRRRNAARLLKQQEEEAAAARAEEENVH
ncbi:RNA polymerase-binding protein RbpA [Corynebacterium sp. ES2794-CONJ1]|uniref:RNA polymerase-binding protein RbpA n=1 Tax=unclassified Corynebacterium TaxID=2624378 RepID=UPI002167065E|nr:MULTISPECIES: RNA polymerase-binding protein RbpA [unclassified Corynebacterium]MCS4489361.1 RNA polymerase-binding protein RbpA [Corynebacterium sp. ES2775-CONJ]MCS4491174.1 RNA polymerase-binding protein RbpA [Corynebacterium sp. ES2715-CONJ3]MCS4530945.1 RNA polymerase-binding protein RbpA [Corynebacterium sp. ES2730-CONJ]MCU9518312.1 RNA polymerase-binding protein RbpA [Corynebacterium sp. ES2794-CONJ1]